MSLGYQKLAANKPDKSLFKTGKTRLSDKPRVLLVEDDRTLRRMVRAEIGDHCDLLVAGNLNLGAAMFKSECPDLAFIDIELTDGSGYNLLQWMLKVKPNAFAVMFSGHSDTNNVCKSVEIGAKGFVSKPFDVNKMLFFIKQCENY